MGNEEYRTDHLVRLKGTQDHRTIIMGPGKCGTTVTVKLLGLLGFETGYTQEALEDPEYYVRYIKTSEDPDGEPARTRLEWPCRGEKADFYFDYVGRFPYIIKSNLLTVDLEECINRWGWKVDHVYLINRDTESLVKRHFIDRYGENYREEAPARRLNIREQTIVNRKAGALDQLSKLDLPFTLINYPTMVENPEYWYNKLEFLMTKAGITYQEFGKKFLDIVDSNLLRGW